MVLRMVEGAVRDAAHCHKVTLPERLARSIAKRAAGTLTAGWRDVLAAKLTPSAREPDFSLSGSGSGARSQSVMGVRSRRSLMRVGDRDGGTASDYERRSPYFRVKKQLGIKAGQAKRANRPELYAAIIEALRAIAKLEKTDERSRSSENP